jgi:hypothetical protein
LALTGQPASAVLRRLLSNIYGESGRWAALSIVLVGLFFPLGGCRKPTPPPFTLRFTVECVNASRVVFTVDHTRRYTVKTQQRYFSGTSIPSDSVSGKVSSADFDMLLSLLREADIPSLPDSYGFSSPDPQLNVYYFLYYATPEKQSFITIRYNPADTLPSPLHHLLTHLASIQR